MKARILWDKYETVLLIDAYLRIRNGEITRKDAVRELSNILRQRAISAGNVIDDIFRNENGISLQMMNIERLMENKQDARKHNTRMFIEMVDMYHTDQAHFKQILNEAKGVTTVETKKDMFFEWLSDKVSASRLSDYFFAINDLEMLARTRNIITGSIFKITDPSISKKIVHTVKTDRMFRFSNRKQFRLVAELANFFHEFVKEQIEKDRIEHSDIDPVKNQKEAEIENPTVLNERKSSILDKSNKGETYTIDNSTLENKSLDALEESSKEDKEAIFKTVNFSKKENYTFTRPVSVTYFGNKTNVSSWRETYITVCRLLYGDYPDKFKELRDVFGVGVSNLVVTEYNSLWMKSPHKIATGYYVETQRNAADLVRNIKAMLDYCQVDYRNIAIYYRNPFEDFQKDEYYAVESSESKKGIGKDRFSVKETENQQLKELNRRIIDVRKNYIHLGRLEFESWLKDKKVPDGTIKTYCEGLEHITKYIQSKNLESRNIFSIRGVKRLTRLHEKLLGCEEYSEERGDSNCQLDCYALKKYITFRSFDSSEEINELLRERFSFILQEFFDNGYRPNSIIDRNRFKQFYSDQYGEDLDQDDDTIVINIKKTGTEQNGRIYIRNHETTNDLIDDIQDEIADTFKDGISCVFYSELFAKYQDTLAIELQIYTEDALKDVLLSTCYDDYKVEKNYFYQKKNKANVQKDIQRVVQASTKPLNYDEIYERLHFIPMDVIKHFLVITNKIVNVARETYFYAPNLPISSHELYQISRLIEDQLLQKNYITDVELREMITKKCPSVAINTESYTTWGLRNALAVLLGDKYSFNGAIISKRGQQINMSKAFGDFCRTHESMTLKELKAFAKDMNSPIYWESVYKEMIRINSFDFVHKSKVHFDIDAIDQILDELVPTDYLPLKEFSLFLHFPVDEVPWNRFVLESFVVNYSKKFILLHASFTATDCCGAVVRSSSKIQDFRSLLSDVLSKSDEWDNKNDALELLVRKGYLQRRKYSEIDNIVSEAKFQRDLKGSSK